MKNDTKPVLTEAIDLSEAITEEQETAKDRALRMKLYKQCEEKYLEGNEIKDGYHFAIEFANLCKQNGLKPFR